MIVVLLLLPSLLLLIIIIIIINISKRNRNMYVEEFSCQLMLMTY